MLDKYLEPQTSLELKSSQAILLADSHGESVGKRILYDSLGIYNFSMGGDSYVDMYHKLVYAKNTMSNLEKVYITVDNHTLSGYRELLHNNNRSLFYGNSTSYKVANGKAIPVYIWNKFIGRYLPCFYLDNNLLFSKIIKKKLKGKAKSGVSTSSKAWGELSPERRAQKGKARFEQQFNSPTSGNLTQVLGQIIEYCNNNDLEVIGLKFPLSPSYSTLIKEKNYGADILFSGRNIPTLDFSSIIEDETCFKDQDHVNEKGRALFVEKLAESLL